MSSTQINRLDDTFHALADPTRRSILANVARGERSVTELAEPFDMSLAAVSKHLRVLERAGLVSRTRQGRVHQLKLDAAPLREAAKWIAFYQKFWTNQLDSLDQFLKTLEPPSAKSGKQSKRK